VADQQMFARAFGDTIQCVMLGGLRPAAMRENPRLIPHIIHFTVPKDLGPDQSEAIERAKSLHPQWEVRVWRDPVDQEGFQLAKYWPLVNSGAQLADLIRIEVVSRFGGVYLDSDVLLLKRLDPLADNCEFFVASENGATATNAVFGARPSHAALLEMIADLLVRPPDWSLPPSETTGPALFQRILKWRQDISLVPRESFYPYGWSEDPKAERPSTYGVHTWSKSWWRPTLWERLDKPRMLWEWKRLAWAVLHRCRNWYYSNEYAIRLLSTKVDSYACAQTIVRRTIHGHYIVLDGRDASITPELVRRGFYELNEELLVRRILRGGDFFIDVGANVGVFALLAASLVGAFGRVYAYEPNPAVLDLLRTSAVMNWMHDRIVLRPVAVGDAPRQAELDFPPARLGDGAIRSATRDTGTFGRTAAYLATTKSVAVDVVTLDAEFGYDIPIKMLKIDAEGFESEVLAGAWRLLSQQCIEYVMLETGAEVSGKGWNTLLQTLEQCCNLGYQPYAVDGHGRLIRVSLDAVARGGSLSTHNLVLKSSR
jgi:FkbM family methyltransferase